MATREELAQSISETCADYRNEELGPFTAGHVLHWAEQFDADEQEPVLVELDHVLRTVYFSEAKVSAFLKEVALEPKLVGTDPQRFWLTAGILKVQTAGNSQREMLERFETVLNENVGVSLEQADSSSGSFLYLDDAVFTGMRVKTDLTPWIETAAPPEAQIHIVVNALHLNGEYFGNQQLDIAIKRAGKKIKAHWWRDRSIENRKYYKFGSEVFWPAELPEDQSGLVAQYVEELKALGYPPEMRNKGGTPKNGVFTGEAGRAVLEGAFLKAGVKIRSICPYLTPPQRPLGFSVLKTLGFGATVVTYRNCPNNCPLALWAGNPWYPLFRRKTN